MYVTTFEVETEPGRRALLPLCVACASRERRPHQRTATIRPHVICAGCGFDDAKAEAFTVAQILDDLVAVVDRSRQLLANRPEWLDELNEAYDWLLRFEGQIITDGHNVLLPSDRDPHVSYSVNGACQCGAHAHRSNARGDKACKHRVRAKLIKRALEARAEIQRQAAAALRQRLAEARYQRSLTEVDELYPA